MPEIASAQASLTADSLVSVGLLIAIIGAVAWLSRALTRTEEQLRGINEKLGNLATLPERMALVEASVANLEGDVNNLWAAARRSNGLTEIRRDRSAVSHHRGSRHRADDDSC